MFYSYGRSDTDRLRDELYHARRTILLLLPEEVQTIAREYHNCTNRHEYHEWRNRLVEVALSKAWPCEQEDAYGPARAYCPLCKFGSSSYYEQGFALPEGLRRHLAGWGNAQACSVLDEIDNLARARLFPEFEKAEAAEAEQRKAERERRVATESLYQLGPLGEPQLLDEIGFGIHPRATSDIDWAASRLRELGFEQRQDGRVSSYVKPAGDFVVYADPRQSGRLEFYVYKTPSPSVLKRRKRLDLRYQTFVLQDSWHNDITAKYDSRLALAVESLKRMLRIRSA